jgi:peptide/nickel transport system permease protein
MARLALVLLARRLLLAVPILFAVSALVFVVLRLLPADPIAMSLPPGASEADMAQLRRDFGLDRSLPEQYAIWVARLLAGEFGTSIHFRRGVGELVAHALPATLELIALGLLFGVIVGVGGGLLLFGLRGTAGEHALDVGSSVLLAIPEVLWAILLILLFGVVLQAMPFMGRLDPALTLPASVTGFLLLDSLLVGNFAAFGSGLWHLLLPAAALAIGLAPLVMRVLRASLQEAIHEDYITMARLRGLPEWRVLLVHALKNASLPTISLIGVQAGFMFGGTVLVEVIFAYPGLGNLMVDAVRNQDLPVIQVVALLYCVLVLCLNALVDVLYLLVNPRLRAA